MSTQKQNIGEVILHLFFFCVNRCERERERDDAIFVDTNNDTNDAKEETTTTIFFGGSRRRRRRRRRRRLF